MDRNSPEFKKLQAEWNKKLAASGFEDIEDSNGQLKGKWSGDSDIRNKYTELTYAAKERYYQLAGQFLNDYPFKTEKDRIIWEMHSEGISIRDIVKALKKRRFKVYRHLVHSRLKFLRSEMRNARKIRQIS